VKPDYWKLPTISNVFFMSGLVLARFLSIILDGMPSPTFSLGILGELILALFALYQLRKHGKTT
jgi:hypothetical protein